MFFDLNVPIIAHQGPGAALQSKKNKGKQSQATNINVFTPAQVAAIEARIDLLVHLGYTVIALNQIIEKKIDSKIHVDILNVLLPLLKSRKGIVFLKRLTINIDEDSEKGFGLTSINTSIADAYDIIALAPTTATTFSAACLTHTLPSPLTAHIIALPLTLPRLPFHLKHTLVRTAIKNGAVFEINYAGALGDPESSHLNLGASDTGLTAKRNWWAAAREVVRVTKGKGILVSGAVVGEGDYRGPRDVQNLVTLLGLPQNLAHDVSTVTPKSLVLRAQTRKTYRAVFSEPTIVVPESRLEVEPAEITATIAPGVAAPVTSAPLSVQPGTSASAPVGNLAQESRDIHQPSASKKRPREPEPEPDAATATACSGSATPSGPGKLTATAVNNNGRGGANGGASARKKRKKKRNDALE